MEPASELDSVLPVSRFRIADPDMSEPLLVTGELSDYYLRKIEAGEPPKTLLERSVEVLAYADDDALVVAPVKALLPGESYSLATPEHGLVATFRVTEEPVAILERRFPAPETPAFPAVVSCGVELPSLPEEAWLEPGHLPLAVTRGVFGDESFGECVSLRAKEGVPDGSYSLPVALGETSLDPAPLVVAAVGPAEHAECLPDEQTFANGCVRVLDDRMIVRSPSAPILWTLRGADASLLVTPDPGGSFVFPDLVPNTKYDIEVGFFDAGGTELRTKVAIATSAARPHVVINEVLANPLGGEPAQEWIELVNDGSQAVELEGWALSDSSGASLLPSFTLAPKAFVILAREDFQRDDGSDVPVPPSVAVLALPTLGKNGLTNSGERLELRSASGEVMSEFPALPKPKAGISVARREPSAVDDASDSFGFHAEPGASPGAPNTL